MALAIVYSRASSGITAPLVTVEAHISYGMAGFFIVGLAETAVKESKDRVRSALMNSHFDFPNRRITINLAPADLPKEGGRFDLPIALGILAASQQIPADALNAFEFAGELALSGALRPIRGVLPMVLSAFTANRQLVIPKQNAHEAAFVEKTTSFYAEHLLEICETLQGKKSLSVCQKHFFPAATAALDLADVKGQQQAKRALEIAAAGKHSVLFLGPPGTGKTMLANRLPTILPALTESEALEVAAINSVSRGGFNPGSWQQIPFRAPHHSSSTAALVGGGRPPKPGEISLAHQGVLFLDELAEFNRAALESLREPLESGVITISRAAYQTHFPAQFQFLAAMNPCPCGYANPKMEGCECTPEQIKRYLAKISGPLLDRLDMHLEVPRLSPEMLDNTEYHAENSAEVKKRVIAARELQWQRQAKYNGLLSGMELEKHSAVSEQAKHLLQQVLTKFRLSARSYHRILKVARSVADLDKTVNIQEHHISEALHFRCLDRAKAI